MTFLFDIGNVLLKLHFERFDAAVLPTPSTLMPPEMLSLKDPYETGAISNDEFIQRSLAILKCSLSTQEFTAAWQNIFSPNTPMWDVVEKLHRSGHRLILFSNTNALHAEKFLADHTIFSLFEHHHFSQDVGAIKPHLEFYQAAIDAYGILPTETIYLDDLPENIATGRDFGFLSFQYDLEDHASCLAWLREQGVRV